MKLDTYEVPVGTDGRTVRVNTVDIFNVNRNIEDNGNNVVKKIKTKKDQVEAAKVEFARTITLNTTIGAPVVEESVVETNVDESKEMVVAPEIGHRYSFEMALEEPVVEEKPVVSAPYQRQNLTATASFNDFSQHVHKMTRLAQLQEEIKTLTVETWRYKTTAKAIEILEECKNNKDEQEIIINNYLKERETKTKEYEIARKNLEDHYKNYMEEINVKIAEAEKTKASIQKFEDARIIEINTSLKNAADADKKEAEASNLIKGIIIDINTAETKKPVSVQNTGVFSKFRDMEEEVEKFDFTKGGRAA